MNKNNKHAWNTGLKQCTDKLRESTRKTNREYKSKSTNQLDLHGNYIRTWCNAHEASRQLRIDRSTIAQCCIGGRRNKTAGGYKWRFAE